MRSQTIVKIETATSEHIPAIVAGMSPTAKEEFKKLYPDLEAEQVVQIALERSDKAFVFYCNGDLVCLLGVNSHSVLDNVGRPWLVPHFQNINKYKKEFLRHTRQWFKTFVADYDRLENVGIQNPRALKWLKWLGFEVGEPVTINGATFYPYTYVRKDT